MKYKYLMLFCLLLVYISSLPLLTPEKVYAEKLDIIEYSTPVNIDPYTGYGEVSRRLIALYSKGLYEFRSYHENGEPKYSPVIASSEPMGEDINKFAFKLKDNIYFYRYIVDRFNQNYTKDSVRITSEDIITTFKNLTNPNTDLLYTDYREKLLKRVDNIYKIENSDSEMFVVFKANKKGSNPRRVLDFPIVPSIGVKLEAISQNPTTNSSLYEYMKHPWGHGPFIIKKIEKRGSTDLFTLERVQPKKNTFDELTLAKYDRTQIISMLKHAKASDYVCFPRLPKGTLSELDGLGYNAKEIFVPEIEMILFNTDKKHLSDWRVRAALSLLLDRETLATKINSEVNLTNGPFSPKYAMYCDTCQIPYYDHNEELAKSLLNEAGWDYDEIKNVWSKDGKKLKVKLLGYSGTDDSYINELLYGVENAWKNFGIEVEPKTESQGTYRKKIKDGDFDAAYFEIRYNYLPNVGKYFASNGQDNYSNIKNSEIDNLWLKLLSNPTNDQIKITWHQLHLAIAQQVPAAFLWSPKSFAAHSNWITVGQNFCPNNFMCDVELWTY